jgi:hypothetical protein
MDKFTVLWNSLPSKPLFLVVAFFWLTSWLFQAEVFPYFSSIITIPFTFLGGLVTVLLLSLWFVKAVESSLNVPNFVSNSRYPSVIRASQTCEGFDFCRHKRLSQALKACPNTA